MKKLNQTQMSGFGSTFNKTCRSKPKPSATNMNVRFFGGLKFHSNTANYSPHKSTLRYGNSKTNLYKFTPRESGELHAEMRFKESMNKINKEGRFKYSR